MLVTAPDPLTSDLASTQAACPYPVSSSTWSAGCRRLLFSYDATTGNVSQISLVAVDGTAFTQTPVAAFTQTPVAAYSYRTDGRGR